MSDSERRAPQTVAEAYLALLASRGIEWLFANAGTDFAPLIEALAGAGGEAGPRAVAVPHEVVAVGMAHGYYLVTGRPQAVMVHVDVGTANALVGIMNAHRAQVPMLFCSGRTPYTESGHLGSRDLPIHWGQEMSDQGSLVREHVKWDYELAVGDQLVSAVDRALAIAMAPPRGPVYLSLPREVLAEPWTAGGVSPKTGQSVPTPAAPDPAAIETAADLLAAAQRPMVISSTSVPRSVSSLGDFADRFALPVVEHWSPCLGLSTEHPMHAGFDPGGLLPEADAVLVLDAPVPWIPARHQLSDDCGVIQVAPDPSYSHLPLRGHRASVAITSDVEAAVQALGSVLESRLDVAGNALERRRQELTARHLAARATVRERAARQPESPTRLWASHLLDRAIGPDALVFNELGCVPPAMRFEQPGSLFSISIAGALGWSLPAALGAQLADRDRLVVATVGDGSYVFANPVACHQVAAALDLPVLTVVFNNQGWQAVRHATLGLYPEGHARGAGEMPLTRVAPSPRYDQVVAASGGHGERVERAEDLAGAFDRALRVVREERRQALVDVVIGWDV